ncbi:MAG: fatty acid cis/trans isomerase [Bacteriovorax sp.]|nr:fatty acid cis/trans isomerase [Bacteriovorax sp.]
MKKWEFIYQKLAISFITILIAIGGLFSYFYYNESSFKVSHYSQSNKRLPSSFNEGHRYPDDEFLSKVQPLLAKRCVACHSCYEAPCLMHFTSYEGIQRGLTKHDSLEVLKTVPRNRTKDAATYLGTNNSPRWDQPEWAKRDFFPIFQLGSNNLLNLDNSIFAMALQHGKENAPGFSLQPSLYPPAHVCAKDSEELKSIYQKYPQSGMPYALPGLEESEYQVLNEWMQKGAPGPSSDTKKVWDEPTSPKTILKFENFFNQTSPKASLTARYIYEHAIMAHIHFSGTPNDEFYELVRASNSSGVVKELVTEKGNDPTPAPFVYRLHRIHDVIVRKTHALWELNEGSLVEWTKLFLDPTWDDEANIQAHYDSLDSYDRQDPMKYFSPIPSKSRFTFMVRNAEMLVGEIVRSPSCSGKIATYAIKDHFWVFFLTAEGNEKYQKTKKMSLSFIDKVKDKIKDKVFSNKLSEKASVAINEKDIDSKMSLSLFRHDKNVTVHKGLWGGDPQSFWVMDYDNYEDLYYNLVINYKPWGNVMHRVLTWEHMVKNRKVAESRFVDLFLSGDKDCTNCATWVWDRWENSSFNRNSNEEMMISTTLKKVQNKILSVMDDTANNQADTLNDFSNRTTDYPKTILEKWEQQMLELTHKENIALLKNLPDLIYVKLIDENGEDRIYSLILNKTYTTNNDITRGTIDQNLIFLPEKNTLIMIKGLIGNHPNLFVTLKIDNAFDFVDKLKMIRSNQDWMALRDQFATHRNTADFWKTYDNFLNWQYRNDPLNAGVIDLNYYQMFE